MSSLGPLSRLTFITPRIFLSRTVCTEGQRADGAGKLTPLHPWLEASRLSSCPGSPSGRKAAHVPPKGDFHIMSIPNASCEGF